MRLYKIYNVNNSIIYNMGLPGDCPREGTALQANTVAITSIRNAAECSIIRLPTPPNAAGYLRHPRARAIQIGVTHRCSYENSTRLEGCRTTQTGLFRRGHEICKSLVTYMSFINNRSSRPATQCVF